MTGDPLGPITIGAREIYDQVVRLQTGVERLVDQNEGIKADVVDHEARIRSLERGRWPLPSLAVLTSLAAIVLAAIPLIR